MAGILLLSLDGDLGLVCINNDATGGLSLVRWSYTHDYFHPFCVDARLFQTESERFTANQTRSEPIQALARGVIFKLRV